MPASSAPTHGGHEPSLVVHMLRDGLLALLANGILAAVVSAALLRTRPCAVPQVDRWLVPRDRGPRLALHAALAFLFIAPIAIMGQNRAELAAAGAAAGLPCPSSAPVTTFDVQAIDVDIPRNRFGDHDPQGKMYVLGKDVAAVRAQEKSQHVSIGLKDNDPIQPLVIRANLGDCVEIAFANNATGGDYGAHIDGLAFNADSSGDNVGRNDPSAVAKGHSRTYRFWVPRDEDLEARTTCVPVPASASRSRTARSARWPSSRRARRTATWSPASRSTPAGRRAPTSATPRRCASCMPARRSSTCTAAASAGG
jgi:hypothetical protein